MKPPLALDRAFGALIGLAVGDAFGAPVENLTKGDIIRRYGTIADLLPDSPGATDDTEFAVLSAMTLLRCGRTLTSSDVATAWCTHLLPQQGILQSGGFSEQAAINLLGRGIEPPETGMRHPESFSDGAAMRATPFGLAWPGRPERAAELAAVDACVSHARDGIWCARALAAGVSVAVVSCDHEDVLAAALAQLPPTSWSASLAKRALAELVAGTSEWSDRVLKAVVIDHYPWADLAPEAFALALCAFAASKGDPVAAITGGANLGRDADTIAGMAGTLAGALRGASAIPQRWREQTNVVVGRCIHSVAGTHLDELAEGFVKQVAAWDTRTP